MPLPPTITNSSPAQGPKPRVPPSTSRRGRVLLGFIACMLLGLSSAACGTSGRELRDPVPGATAPPRRTSTTSSGNVQVIPDDSNVVLQPSGFTLGSPSWSADGEIPLEFGCGGEDIAPPLTISGVPDGTAELLLIATERDARSRTRWIVAAIPIATTSITQGVLPPGAVAVVNSSGSASWAGPCPTPGSSTTFQLRLYALRTPSEVTAASDSPAVTVALTTATQAAVLRGTYTRPR
jgi:phosphatidylethanolamine-binding protein (PEBP) family uncharacterized protein